MRKSRTGRGSGYYYYSDDDSDSEPLIESTDLPAMSMLDQGHRQRLRLQIVDRTADVIKMVALEPYREVVIEGLEVLQESMRSSACAEDDFSYDSFAIDSMEMALNRLDVTAAITHEINYGITPPVLASRTPRVRHNDDYHMSTSKNKHHRAAAAAGSGSGKNNKSSSGTASNSNNNNNNSKDKDKDTGNNNNNNHHHPRKESGGHRRMSHSSSIGEDDSAQVVYDNHDYNHYNSRRYSVRRASLDSYADRSMDYGRIQAISVTSMKANSQANAGMIITATPAHRHFSMTGTSASNMNSNSMGQRRSSMGSEARRASMGAAAAMNKQRRASTSGSSMQSVYAATLSATGVTTTTTTPMVVTSSTSTSTNPTGTTQQQQQQLRQNKSPRRSSYHNSTATTTAMTRNNNNNNNSTTAPSSSNDSLGDNFAGANQSDKYNYPNEEIQRYSSNQSYVARMACQDVSEYGYEDYGITTIHEDTNHRHNHINNNNNKKKKDQGGDEEDDDDSEENGKSSQHNNNSATRDYHPSTQQQQQQQQRDDDSPFQSQQLHGGTTHTTCVSVDSQDYGKYKTTSRRRNSLGSYANDSCDQPQQENLGNNSSSNTTRRGRRRGSVGVGMDNDGVPPQDHNNNNGQAKSMTGGAARRRNSLGSCEGEQSIETMDRNVSVSMFGYKTQMYNVDNNNNSNKMQYYDRNLASSCCQSQTSSVNSSNALRNSTTTRTARMAAARRSSLGSIEDESMDYGKYKSTCRRRNSLGSYANDSLCGGGGESVVGYGTAAHAGPSNTNGAATADGGGGRRMNSSHFQRRSSLGSIENDSVDYNKYKSTSRSQRRNSLGSYANDSFHRGYGDRNNGTGTTATDSIGQPNGAVGRMNSNMKSMRRSSLGSYANDSMGDFGSFRMNSRAASTAMRRSSLGSCANESVDYSKYKSTARRSSIGSYANDSFSFPLQAHRHVMVNAPPTTSGSNNNNNNMYNESMSSLGAFFNSHNKPMQQQRRSSLGSMDSMDYGRYRSTARRASIGSYANDSFQMLGSNNNNNAHASTHNPRSMQRRSSLGSIESNDYGRYRSTARRASMGSYADDSFQALNYNHTGNGTTRNNMSGPPMQRRSSLGSIESLDYGRFKSTARRSSLGSYAEDSFGQTSNHYNVGHQSIVTNLNAVKMRPVQRRCSLGSIEDSLEYGRYKSTSKRRGSMGSFANDSLQNMGYNSHHVPASNNSNQRQHMQRRSSLGSCDSNYVMRDGCQRPAQRRCSLGSIESRDYGRYRSTARRASVGSSYANDSLNGHNKTTLRPVTMQRRSSLGSLDNDSSMEYGRYKSTVRRASIGSFASDSLECLRHKSTARRASIGSSANESLDVSRPRQNPPSTRTRRRMSMGSAVGSASEPLTAEYGRFPQTRRSSLGSSGELENHPSFYGGYAPEPIREELEPTNYAEYYANPATPMESRGGADLFNGGGGVDDEAGKFESKRRLSCESYCSGFSPEVIETLSITRRGSQAA